MESRGEHESTTHIRDPVYDEVGMSELEVEILDKPEVQRLRQIKQLGEVARVYPSATHTRFTHSIGVMHVSGLIANQLGLEDKEITEARIAGLLHDTGHGPFSHTSEEVVGEEVFHHEERSAEIAERVCSDLPIDESNVSDYILGEKQPSVVAGIIDSDRLDYIVRDSIFTSVDHGLVDVHSIVRFCTLNDGEIAFEEKAVPSINDMISARLRMMKVVYRYSTVRHFATLIKRAMEQYVQRESVEELIQHDDYTMHSELLSENNEYYEQLTNRDLSRERYEVGLDDGLSKQDLRRLASTSDSEIRDVLSEYLEVSTDNILVSSPYIPANVPDKTTIVGENGTAKLGDFSKYPQYIHEESWNDSSFILYASEGSNVDKKELVSASKSIK